MRNVLTFISGVLLALAILFLTGVGAARYMIGRLSIPPEKPVFDNETPSTSPSTSPSAQATMSVSPEVSPAAATPTPEPVASETPASPSPTPSPETGYTAKIIQPIGLILRESPTQDSRQIAGLAYNTEVIVLEENADGSWLRVQLPSSGVEGWIKAGNTEEVQ